MKSYFRQSAVALLYLGPIVCLGCDETCENGTDQARASSNPIRLADLLEVATIQSPLIDIPAASNLEQLGDIQRRTIFEEDFSAYDLAAARRVNSPSDAVVETDRGRSFFLREAGNPKPRAAWVVEVEPNTQYVFARSVKTSGALVADFEVMESDRNLPVEKLLDGAGRKALLKVHWLNAPEPDGTWQRDSISFHTMAYTHALVIVLWQTDRRSLELSASETGGGSEAWFDDLELARLEPTRDQAIALFKAQNSADGSNPLLGMRKYGQFPPLLAKRSIPGDPSSLGGNYSHRFALYTPPPTELAFPIAIEPGAYLRFAVCLARVSSIGSAARFEVLVRSSGREESLWSETLTADPVDWEWREARVDLSAYEGCSVSLILKASAEEGDPHPMWSNPVVEYSIEGQSPKNLILIAVDTLRADRLACYGYERLTSPNIDALAADGVRFEQVVSNSTWTCPSFASILTGVVPSRHGVWNTAPQMRLPAQLDTLAERFHAAGWATQAIVFKAPLYSGGFDQGFDVSYIVPRAIPYADENLAKALEWLDSNANRRNFLFLHFNDPHQPFAQPNSFVRSFGKIPKKVRLPYKAPNRPPEKRDQEIARALYDGEIAYVDDRIGVFLDELKQRSLYDESVILFVSDHGEEFWERGAFGHGNGSMYDESIRVPLIVKPVKGTFPCGQTVRTQVRAFDVMPTLLELAGIPVTPDLDASSLVPLLDGAAPDRIAVSETRSGDFGVRTQKWKYIFQSESQPNSTEQLYDLEVDPDELKDVAKQNPDVVVRMRLQLFDYLLLHRPGRYLVAIGPPSSGSQEYEIGGVSLSEPLRFGIADARAEAGSLKIQTVASDTAAWLVVASIVTSGPITFSPTDSGTNEFYRYTAGELTRLYEKGETSVLLFEGPAPLRRKSGSNGAADLKQVEALRALGYLGEDE